MSKADYLAKYLDGSTSKAKAKRKSKHKSEKTVQVIVVDDDLAKQEVAVALDDGMSEDEPVTVQEVVGTKAFKGFKRIDGKNIEPETGSTTLETNEGASVPPKQSTVYRDASGKIIDIAAKRAELKLEKERTKEKQRQRAEALNHTELSQIEQQEQEQRLRSAKSFTVSINDQEYNRKLQQQDRFEDPLSAFGAQSSTKTSSDTGYSRTGRPTYNKGISPANRHGIAAGWFWDGIDRSNGFEELVMRKRNDISHSKYQKDSYELEIDDE